MMSRISISHVMFSFLLCAGLSLSACSSDTNGEETDTGLDQGTGDQGSGDQGGGEDQGTEDMAKNDMAVPDMTSDMAEADHGVDMSTDMSADMPQTDMPEDGQGCAANTTTNVGVAGQIVGCVGPTESLDQCEAASMCGTGWHMCTTTEYRAHYETVEPPGGPDGNILWLAGCVRDGVDVGAPVDGICAECTDTSSGGDKDISWSCVNSLRVTTDQLYVGVRSSSACTSVGVDAQANRANWTARPSYYEFSGAFCCVD